MIEKGKISTRQMTLMLIAYMLGDAIILTPGLIYAKQDAWLSNIIALLIGLVYFFFLSKFFNLLQGKSLVKYTINLCGEIVGRILILPLILYLILDVVLVIRETGFMLSTVIFEETPILFFSITIVLICAYTIKKGLEVIARNCEIIVPILIISLLLILILIIFTTINIDNLKPVMASGILPVFKGALPNIGFPILDSVVFLFLIPYLNNTNQSKIRKGFTKAIIIGIGLLLFRPINTIGTFGQEEPLKMTFPIFEVIRMIQFGDVIERLESFFLPIWISTSYIKILIIYYVLSLSLAELFNLSNYKHLILPFGLILVILSYLITDNFAQISFFSAVIWFLISIIPCLIIPLTIYIIEITRK